MYEVINNLMERLKQITISIGRYKQSLLHPKIRPRRKHCLNLIFWGGGVDTQKTLPFGTPDEVYAEVLERIRLFNNPTGMVFNTTHNIQAKTPVENVLAMFKAIKDSSKH